MKEIKNKRINPVRNRRSFNRLYIKGIHRFGIGSRRGFKTATKERA